MYSYLLGYVPDHFKTQEMCNKAVNIKSLLLVHVPGSFKTQEMCIKVVEADPLSLVNVLDRLKTREMCDAAVKDDAFSLVCVSNWLVTQQHVKLWDDQGDYCDDDEIIKWYEGYQKQKAKIEEELMCVVWHSLRWWDCCMSEDEKKETEKLWKQLFLII